MLRAQRIKDRLLVKLLSRRTDLCGTYFFILGTVLSRGPPSPSDCHHWEAVFSGLQVPLGNSDTPLHKSHVIPPCSPGATPLSCQLRENMALEGRELGHRGQQEPHNLAIRWCIRNLSYEPICRGSLPFVSYADSNRRSTISNSFYLTELMANSEPKLEKAFHNQERKCVLS